MPTVITTEVLAPDGVIVNLRFRTPCGKVCNALGTPVTFQSLADWEGYVSQLRGQVDISNAWRLLLNNNQAHDFEPGELEKARRLLAAKDEKLEMIYKEK